MSTAEADPSVIGEQDVADCMQNLQLHETPKIFEFRATGDDAGPCGLIAVLHGKQSVGILRPLPISGNPPRIWLLQLGCLREPIRSFPMSPPDSFIETTSLPTSLNCPSEDIFVMYQPEVGLCEYHASKNKKAPIQPNEAVFPFEACYYCCSQHDKARLVQKAGIGRNILGFQIPPQLFSMAQLSLKAIQTPRQIVVKPSSPSLLLQRLQLEELSLLQGMAAEGKKESLQLETKYPSKSALEKAQLQAMQRAAEGAMREWLESRIPGELVVRPNGSWILHTDADETDTFRENDIIVERAHTSWNFPPITDKQLEAMKLAAESGEQERGFSAKGQRHQYNMVPYQAVAAHIEFKGSSNRNLCNEGNAQVQTSTRPAPPPSMTLSGSSPRFFRTTPEPLRILIMQPNENNSSVTLKLMSELCTTTKYSKLDLILILGWGCFIRYPQPGEQRARYLAQTPSQPGTPTQYVEEGEGFLALQGAGWSLWCLMHALSERLNQHSSATYWTQYI